MYGMQNPIEAEAWRLLRVLLFRGRAMSADSRGASERRRAELLRSEPCPLTRGLPLIGSEVSPLAAAAWWLPQLAIIVALSLPPAIRTVIWAIALAWMGTACVSNNVGVLNV
jgi:hypothetical protein